jgi:aryl-alcohol dehydrogenase-like predicted oxidoreductase
MTKCGRYGVWDFDYSPATIRASVMRSLDRMNTPYLDVVYLHDLEYVATQVPPPSPSEGSSGRHVLALTEKAAEYGLAPGNETKAWGEGDQKVLDAIAEMRRMQDEGLIKNVGISGEYQGLVFVFEHSIPWSSQRHTRLPSPDSVAHCPPRPAHNRQASRRTPFLFAPQPSG